MTITSKSTKRIGLFIFIFCNLIFAILYIPILLVSPNNALLAILLMIVGLLFGAFFSSIFIFFRKDQVSIEQGNLIYKNLFSNKKIKIDDIKSMRLTMPLPLYLNNPFESIFSMAPATRLEIASQDSKLLLDSSNYDKEKFRLLLQEIKNKNENITTDEFVKNILSGKSKLIYNSKTLFSFKRVLFVFIVIVSIIVVFNLLINLKPS